MTDIAICVDNLGKMYRIGAREKRADTLRETLGHLAASPFDYLRRNPNHESRGYHLGLEGRLLRGLP